MADELFPCEEFVQEATVMPSDGFVTDDILFDWIPYIDLDKVEKGKAIADMLELKKEKYMESVRPRKTSTENSRVPIMLRMLCHDCLDAKDFGRAEHLLQEYKEKSPGSVFMAENCSGVGTHKSHEFDFKALINLLQVQKCVPPSETAALKPGTIKYLSEEINGTFKQPFRARSANRLHQLCEEGGVLHHIGVQRLLPFVFKRRPRLNNDEVLCLVEYCKYEYLGACNLVRREGDDGFDERKAWKEKARQEFEINSKLDQAKAASKERRSQDLAHAS